MSYPDRSKSPLQIQSRRKTYLLLARKRGHDVFTWDRCPSTLTPTDLVTLQDPVLTVITLDSHVALMSLASSPRHTTCRRTTSSCHQAASYDEVTDMRVASESDLRRVFSLLHEKRHVDRQTLLCRQSHDLINQRIRKKRRNIN